MTDFEQELVKIKNLSALQQFTDTYHNSLFPSHKLLPIHGAGCTKSTKYMFVFINPTYRNQSSDGDWKGKRYPFIGTKQIWRILDRAGLFDKSLLERIEKNRYWDNNLIDDVEEFLNKKSIYMTNLVKWTGENADLPKETLVNQFLPILHKEIELVKPKNIVAFGLIPLHALTDKVIKLNDYYQNVMRFKIFVPIRWEKDPNVFIYPCYFPLGRGNPKRAVELLTLLP